MVAPKLRFKGFSQNWFKISLSSVGEVVTGNTPATSEKKYYGDDFLWVSPADIKNQKLVNDTQTKLSILGVEKTRKIPNGSILVTCIGSTIGKIAMSGKELSTNQQINSLIPNSPNLKDFIYYSIECYIPLLKKLTATQAVPIINKSEFSNFKIPFTSENEAIKIGELFSNLDIRIQLQQEKIDLLKEQKKGFMQKIFSRELRFKDNNGDEFSNWKTQTLNTLGEFGKSYSYSRAFEGKGTVQHIHYGDIHSNLPTVCDQIQFPFITEQREFEFVNTGDILFADASEDYSDLGKAILIKSLQSDKTIAGLHTHKFTPNELVYPLYLIYLTQTRSYRTFIKKVGTGVSVLGISKTNLSKFEVPLPSLNEQIKIGEFLFSFDKKITTLEKQKVYLIQQKQAFMQQMFI